MNGKPTASKKKRLCKLPGCRLPFRPKRKDQLFCCKQHCDDYHKRGALPFEKLVDDVAKRITPSLLARMDALEKLIADRVGSEHLFD